MLQPQFGMKPNCRDGVTHSVRRRGLLSAVGVSLLAGCRGTPESDGMRRNNGDGSPIEWTTIELSTVRGEETFTIDELDGPAVIQTFTVWSSACEQQSENLSGLADSTTVISLNMDASEDAATVREYANTNGFDWRFAVTPTEMKNGLISEFGPSVTEASSTPIIVACEDGSTAYRAGSVVATAEIERLIAEC